MIPTLLFHSLNCRGPIVMAALVLLSSLARISLAAEHEAHAVASEHATEGHVQEAEGPPELPNIFVVIQKMLPEDSPTRHFLHTYFHNKWDNIFFTYLIVIVTGVVLAAVVRHRVRQVGRGQGIIEGIVEGLYNFFRDVMGPENARTFVPLVGSLFIFIFLNNIIGIVPLMKSPSATPVTTFALSLTVFCVVQVVGIMRCGVWGRIYHLMGSPKDAVGWVFAPLLFVLEVIGELVKPVSLALRLFGNIFGEDILLGSFAFMGVLLWSVVGVDKPAVGVPLQFPFLFLALLTSTIQALVFSLLASIYILLALPHHEEHGEAH